MKGPTQEDTEVLSEAYIILFLYLFVFNKQRRHPCQIILVGDISELASLFRPKDVHLLRPVEPVTAVSLQPR